MEPRRPLIGDRYEFLRLIATGGMGQVWCARDTLLHRDVAVKVLRSEFTGNPTFLARFRAEAQHTAALVHPNIAALHDYGEIVPGPDGQGEHVAYLVMEFVDGEPLSAVLAREGRLDPDRTLRLLHQVAAGLAAAHAAGVVHRDVKPANVLVGRDGVVKITDFGIASSTASVPLTKTGEVIGTAHYLAPEQAQGARATPASDVYALGMVAYECLTGHRAFEGESSVQIALRHIREQPAPLPPDVPPAVRRLVGRALVKDPAERLADGAAFRDAVEAVLAGADPVVQPPTTDPFLLPGLVPPLSEPVPGAEVPAAEVPAAQVRVPRRPERERRRRAVAALVALAVVVVLGAAAVAVALGRPTGSPATAASERSAAPATSSRVAASSPTPTIEVNAGDYVGQSVAQVQQQLAALGLQVQTRQLTTGDLPAGQVIAVVPSGALLPGTMVTVTAAAALPVVASAPTSAAAVPVAPSAPVKPPAGGGGGKRPGPGHGKRH